MTGQDVFVDAAVVLRTWLRGLPNLSGVGQPIPGGFHLKHQRSASKAYVLLYANGGGQDDTYGISQARVSAQIFGLTIESAGVAAVAYANALMKLDGTQVSSSAGTLLTSDDVTGPLYSQDRDTPRYLVDCLLLLHPGP